MDFFQQIAIIYIWGAIVTLLFFLFLIARFYEHRSGQGTRYRAFLIPICLFTFGAIRYSLFSKDFVGDPLGDIAFFAGGVAVCLLGYLLLKQMMG